MRVFLRGIIIIYRNMVIIITKHRSKQISVILTQNFIWKTNIILYTIYYIHICTAFIFYGNKITIYYLLCKCIQARLRAIIEFNKMNKLLKKNFLNCFTFFLYQHLGKSIGVTSNSKIVTVYRSFLIKLIVSNMMNRLHITWWFWLHIRMPFSNRLTTHRRYKF